MEKRFNDVLSRTNKMNTISRIINEYFKDSSTSEYMTTFENMKLSKTLLFRLPKNSNIEYEFLRTLIEETCNIGAVQNHYKYTSVDEYGLSQDLYVIYFKFIMIGSETVNNIHTTLLQYGYMDMHVYNDSYLIPIRIFYDARVNKRVISANREFNRNKTDNVERFKDPEKNTSQRINREPELEPNKQPLVEENQKLTTKVEYLESSVNLLKKELKETKRRLAELEDDHKWWRKILHNKMETMRTELYDDIIDRLNRE
jgi:hypothetical protein